GSLSPNFGRQGPPLFAVLLSIVMGCATSWLYEALLESSEWQATVGKMIFGMKVTDLAGNRISFGQATARYFAKWLSAASLCIGFLMVAFSARKQGLHDILAGTLVQRG